MWNVMMIMVKIIFYSNVFNLLIKQKLFQKIIIAEKDNCLSEKSF